MSTLTKILIVLVTVSSIFLCGLVATYVAIADNYRQKYDTVYQDLSAAKANERSAQQQLREKIEETDREKNNLNQQIASLKIQIGQLEASLNELERQKAVMAQEVDKFSSIVEGFTKTNDQQGLLLGNAMDRLKTVEGDLITERSRHKETNNALLEQMTIVANLQAKYRQVVEERDELQTKLDQFLSQYGRAIVPPKPVTPITTKARPAPLVTRDIGLKGQITLVDLKNSMAQISIGTAHGAKEGMRFHVIRGDEYICDILLLDVEPERAVGAIELTEVTKQQPRVSDGVATNL